MEANEGIFGKLMANSEFRKLTVEYLLHKVYGVFKNGTFKTEHEDYLI